MKRLNLLPIMFAGAFFFLLVACQPTNLTERQFLPAATPAPDTTQAPDEASSAEEVGLPNPASVNCEDQGYVLEMRQGEGGTYGVCLFPDGSECDEWAFLRGECQPGDSLSELSPAPQATATPITQEGTWQRYTNESPAYTFLYPPEAVLEPGDDARQSVTITGPLVDDDHWPMFFISHPQDRAEFRPPADADLAQWLVEQNLLPVDGTAPAAEALQQERSIGGTRAIHTRFERSPQSYAYDKYLFAHDGQLYTIVILHTGDREDWALYNQFLDSFEFLPETTQGDSFRPPAACPPTSPGTYLLYDGNEGYCFLYPVDFDVFQSEGGSLTLYRRSLLNTEAPSATIQVEAADGRSLATVTEQRLTDFAFADTQAQEMELGGQKANLLDNLPGQDLNRRLLTVYQDQIYELIVARIGADYGPVGDEAASLFDLIASSWRFVDKDPQVGLRAGPECPPQEQGTTLFRSEEDGYCLLLPDSYQVDTSLMGAEGSSETAVYQDSPLDAARARLFITVEDAQQQSLDEITQAFKDEIEAALPGLDLTWSAGLMLGGVWTNEFAQVPGQDLARVLLLIHDGRLYTLTFIPDDPDAGQAYEEMQALYELVLDTFSFLWAS